MSYVKIVQEVYRVIVHLMTTPVMVSLNTTLEMKHLQFIVIENIYLNPNAIWWYDFDECISQNKYETNMYIFRVWRPATYWTIQLKNITITFSQFRQGYMSSLAPRVSSTWNISKKLYKTSIYFCVFINNSSGLNIFHPILFSSWLHSLLCLW